MKVWQKLCEPPSRPDDNPPVSARRLLNAGCVVMALAASVLACGGEAPQTVPAGTAQPRPVSLACVEATARGDSAVAAVETRTPSRGPLAAARGYLTVRLEHGGYITITEWPSGPGAERAARSYMADRGVSIESSGSSIRTVTVMSDTVTVGEVENFRPCGLLEP